MTTYSTRAKANYEAKLPIYLFDCCVNQKIPTFDGFILYKLDDPIIIQYATKYMQFERREFFNDILSINTIYEFIKKWKENEIFQYSTEKYINYFKTILAENEFDRLILNKGCSYCGISERQIDKLGREEKLYNKRADTRGYSLEIDRKNPNKEYTINNICMSCYWCNNAKTDEFTVEEFKEIARGINGIWQKRLGTEVVVFPETFYQGTKGDEK